MIFFRNFKKTESFDFRATNVNLVEEEAESFVNLVNLF